MGRSQASAGRSCAGEAQRVSCCHVGRGGSQAWEPGAGPALCVPSPSTAGQAPVSTEGPGSGRQRPETSGRAPKGLRGSKGGRSGGYLCYKGWKTRWWRRRQAEAPHVLGAVRTWSPRLPTESLLALWDLPLCFGNMASFVFLPGNSEQVT